MYLIFCLCVVIKIAYLSFLIKQMCLCFPRLSFDISVRMKVAKSRNPGVRFSYYLNRYFLQFLSGYPSLGA